ncbi:MAG: type II toxin-antitoxin system RelE/ParE family toxin [Sulfuricurvum sp.]
MPIELEKQYLKDRQRAIKSISEVVIEKTEKLFECDPFHPSLHNKPIICSKDKYKRSLRIGTTGYRVIYTVREDISYFQRLIDHDIYDRLTKGC